MSFDLRISESEEQIRKLEELLKKKRARKAELERQKKQQQQKEKEKWLQEVSNQIDALLIRCAGELYWEKLDAGRIFTGMAAHLEEVLYQIETKKGEGDTYESACTDEIS